VGSTSGARFPSGGSAFEAFVREAGPGLLRFGHVLTLDRAAAEDLAQETFIRVGLAWSRVRADGNPAGYARRTMVNVFLNQRRRRAEVPVGTPPETAAEDRRLAAVESVAEIRRMLARLPTRQRAAVAMRYVADMSDDQIADVLRCSAQTVRSQISRGLATLRQQPVEER
jgi:RNA polymerase sigma-70 factor (sigma-E family)